MSATGTPTPNIGLRRPQGTDPASVDDINYNSALLDTKLGAVGSTSLQDQIDTLSTNTAQNLGKVQDGLAIVANGNTHVAIPADYFVYVKGHNSLSEGLYKNTSGSTIAANATLSTSNLTADDDGGLNSVYDALNSKVTITTPTTPTYSNLVDSSYINRFYIQRYGDIVAIGGEFKAASLISAETAVIATGVVAAYNNTLGQFTAIDSSNSKPIQLDVNGSGQLTTFYGGSIPAGAIVRFAATYLMKTL